MEDHGYKVRVGTSSVRDYSESTRTHVCTESPCLSLLEVCVEGDLSREERLEGGVSKIGEDKGTCD